MKKTALLLLLCIIFGVFASCGPAGNESANESGAESKNEGGDITSAAKAAVEKLNSLFKHEINRSEGYKRVNVISGSSYTLGREPSETFSDNGKSLTDDNIAAFGDEKGWLGFIGRDDITFTVDLGGLKTELSDFELNGLLDLNNGRNLAPKCEIYISEDGKEFTKIGSAMTSDNAKTNSAFTYSLKLQKAVDAAFVRYELKGIRSNWTLIDNAAIYRYEKDGEQVNTGDYYYKNEDMPEVTEKLYWDSSESDYAERINLISGLGQRVYVPYPLLAEICTDYYNTPASSKKLTDGKHGGTVYSDEAYFHFTRGMSRDVIYDIGKLSSVDGFSVGFYRHSEYGITPPTGIKLYLSENGKDWENVNFTIPSTTVDENRDDCVVKLEKAYEARFAKFKFTTTAHIWLDEIELYGTKKITENTVKLKPAEEISELPNAYPSYDALGGSENIILSYNFNVENPAIGLNTKEELLPYVGYFDNSGELKDIFFDSYLFLPTATVCKSGAVLHDDKKRPSAKRDWLDYEEDLFMEGYNINALQEAVAEVKTQLGREDFIAKVYFPIFSTTTTQNNFGSIDDSGRSLSFDSLDDRKAAVKWWIDKLIERYEAGEYGDLTLHGFYWFHESLDASDRNEFELVNYTADYLHEKGYYLIWIPYYQSSGFSEWSEYGFDGANMQPNYMFDKNENANESIVYSNAELTKAFGMGVEIEISGKAISDINYYNRYLSYLRIGVETGYIDSVKMYYQDGGPGVFYNSWKSDDPRVRSIYDLTYKYAKGILKEEEIALEATEFSGNANEELRNNIKLKSNNSYCTIELAASAKYGDLRLNSTGSFQYTPMEGFAGEDSFIIRVNYGVNTEEIEIKLNIK